MKFQKIDEKYLKQRAEFSSKYGSREIWSIIDHWPLYCGIVNLARFMAIAEIFKGVLLVPGHIVEFGSWRGTNLLFLAKLLRIYDPHGCKQVYCFDSFEGLTHFSQEDGETSQFGGVYTGSLDELEDIIKLYEMEDEIVIVKGIIEETLPSFLDRNKQLTFSMVYCDTDLYSSTRTRLSYIHHRLAKGGVIIFDEWNYEDFPGEGVAVNEFLDKHGNAYELHHVLHSRQPSMYIRKTSY